MLLSDRKVMVPFSQLCSVSGLNQRDTASGETACCNSTQMEFQRSCVSVVEMELLTSYSVAARGGCRNANRSKNLQLFPQDAQHKLVPKVNPKMRIDDALATISHPLKLFSPPAKRLPDRSTQRRLRSFRNLRGRVTLIIVVKCGKRIGHSKKKYSLVKELTDPASSFIHRNMEKVGASCANFAAQRGLALAASGV